MGSPSYSILYSAAVGSVVSNGLVADVLIRDITTGRYVLATTAARAGRRSTGIALSIYVANGVVDIQQEGELDATTAGLGAGTASYVRVSTLGRLERVTTPGATDDVVGWVEADGTTHLRFGQPPGGYGSGVAVPAQPVTGIYVLQSISGVLTWTMAAAPTVTAITPTSGTDLGGTAVVITVNDSTGATSAAVGGVNLTSFAIVDATHVSGVTGAHAAGATSVTVTNSFGTSSPLVGAFTYVASFTPASLNLSGWWRADYPGTTWPATASAGVSATTGALVAGHPPPTGTAQNGKVPAEFNGTTHDLANGVLMSTLFSAGAGTIIAIFRAASASAPSGTAYNDPCILSDIGGEIGINFTTAGVNGFLTTSGGQKTLPTAVAASTGTYHIAMMRWDGVNLGITVDSGAEVTVAAGNASILTNSLAVGMNYSGAARPAMRLLELMTSPTTISPTNYGNVKTYANALYATSF